MKVTALPSASNRTKQRVKLLTDSHIIRAWSKSSRFFKGSRAVLFEKPGDQRAFFGWLPYDEIEIEGIEFGQEVSNP